MAIAARQKSIEAQKKQILEVVPAALLIHHPVLYRFLSLVFNRLQQAPFDWREYLPKILSP